MRKIELLAPAKTADHGIEAINHGADAVYIGAPEFSARANAGNSIQEIERLIAYAHKFNAKIYVALNTILTDAELEKAEHLIHQLYNIGSDALIIQDFGITQLNLPPIALHASTQMDNRSVEKVKFLESVGFDQVVLARELSIDQIRKIGCETHVKLEAFIHGALCVSYSGQCYFSQHLCGRSANRGVCAQLCRLPYSLKDGNGRFIVKNKFLLSLKDFNLSSYLGELIEAGVSSLKIEGRLKDVEYVKNVTAFYRQKLDIFLNENDNYQKASSGNCTYTFIPDIEKSFHRGSTDYFLHGRNKQITSFFTPKSLGEKIGTITNFIGNRIIVDIEKEQTVLNNGDGFAYLNNQQQFCGFKANIAEENYIIPDNITNITSKRNDLKGKLLYRNFDQAFNNALKKNSATRKISVDITLDCAENGFIFTATDEDGNIQSLSLNAEKTVAKDEEKQIANIITIMKKSGNTIFSIENVILNWEKTFFIPSAQLTDIRRNLLELLSKTRSENYHTAKIVFKQTDHPYILSEIDYRGNIHNQRAKKFFTLHHVKNISPSYESVRVDDAELMRCKHCIRYSLGFCKLSKNIEKITEPLSLVTENGKEVELEFDCVHCEMVLKKSSTNTLNKF